MDIPSHLLYILVLVFILQTPTFVTGSKRSFIIYFGRHTNPHRTLLQPYGILDNHFEFMTNYLGCKDKAKRSIFYSYHRFINGFAANLEENQVEEIRKRPGVISVFPNQGRQLHTTRSWYFLGMEKDEMVDSNSIWQHAKFGEDVIIGNLDTGVWPESESFKDDGMGPIPSKWKGLCQFDSKEGKLCNKKLIGSRYFNKGYEAYYKNRGFEQTNGPFNTSTSLSTSRDFNGHGTHTLSTSGGRFVGGANVFGFANGTAKGGAPSARLASYKVCWPPLNGTECFDADILAAFDAAIDDGVDVLSLSLGSSPTDYFADGIAIGSFHAVRHGIAVVSSAGNSGPTMGTVANVAPWMLTVGASSIDRNFPSYVKLGDGKKYQGQSLSSEFLPDKMYPLTSGADARASFAPVEAGLQCLGGALEPSKVKGKIVLCRRGGSGRVDKGGMVKKAGGVGMILSNAAANGFELVANAHLLPATHVSAADEIPILNYINSTKSPTASITRPETILGTKPAPVMAAFSSQGPNLITPEILKPDITAPGVNILAAYSMGASASEVAGDGRRVAYNILSGTSMSCPHMAGIVALLRKLHPDWSHAAIRSAIMTTARALDNTNAPITNSSMEKATPFSYGAGHVDPSRAADPGLVYDVAIEEYLVFLCSIGYDSSMLGTFAERPYTCPSEKKNVLDFNYPSITVPNLNGSVTVSRTLKNVGSAGKYSAKVEAPNGVDTSVDPPNLEFLKTGEEKTFKLTLAPNNGGQGQSSGYSFGKLTWSDGVHQVTSPIVVSFDQLDSTQLLSAQNHEL